MTPNNTLPAVIFSGGAEIVSISVAEALIAQNIPLIVIGLGKPSLLRDVQGGMIYKQIPWPPSDISKTLTDVTDFLISLGAGKSHPWPAFATEDGSLRFLFENRDALSPYLAIPQGSPYLKLSGLDKAEFFQFLDKTPAKPYLAPSIVVKDISSAEAALKTFGGRAIFKPALKPLSMQFRHLSAKAFLVDETQSKEYWQKILENSWQDSPDWIVQPYLQTSSMGEALWWGIRTHTGQIEGITAYERWKQPRLGGSACWVEARVIPELFSPAKIILDALNFVGVCELPFLLSQHGEWKLLEVNARPWLQVGLTTTINFPLIHALYQDLCHQAQSLSAPNEKEGKSWVNIERLLISAWSGDYGPRLPMLMQVLDIICKADYVAVYGSPLPKVRLRWLKRIFGKLFK